MTKGKFAVCMTAQGTYYFRHITVPDALRGQVLAVVDTLHEAANMIIDRHDVKLPTKQEAGK